jgi:hypothetical protein
MVCGALCRDRVLLRRRPPPGLGPDAGAGQLGEGTWKGRLPAWSAPARASSGRMHRKALRDGMSAASLCPRSGRGALWFSTFPRQHGRGRRAERRQMRADRLASWASGCHQSVKFGERNMLRVRVLAITTADTVPNFMGTVDSQVSFQKATLDSRGSPGTWCSPAGRPQPTSATFSCRPPPAKSS